MTEFFDSVRTAQVTAPALELVLALVMLAACLIFKATRTGLLVAFLFVYRWGWLFIEETFVDQWPWILFGYVASGALLVALSVLGMLRHSDEEL